MPNPELNSMLADYRRKLKSATHFDPKTEAARALRHALDEASALMMSCKRAGIALDYEAANRCRDAAERIVGSKSANVIDVEHATRKLRAFADDMVRRGATLKR